MANIFGILFDLDGTLVDNEHMKALAFSRAIERLGGKSDPSIYEKVMGMSGPIIRKRFIIESGVQVDSDEYFGLYKSIYEDLLKAKLEIRPGVITFLDDLKSAGLKLAVVSSAYQEVVNWIIETSGIFEFIDTMITGDDVINKKPAPDCFLAALETLMLSKENVVVFEDTEVGLRAAKRAGITSLGIRHSYNQSHDFSTAYNEYSSFEEEIKMMKRDLNQIFYKPIL
jgi:HAD superfamily hydrolase (TIGR01509 family)